ncbi:Lytic transglycosylase catalytic [Desulfamplus magnetovallimortis]|uniref:Lytic transglycosylase catalytic n=1 Tax=Desulfamplus magnetovallimortis TaxID=1246637 RepID=A0A1W1HAL7_9BACT|nr:lytic transglycosylase domain-containing protein [Desulfamplus magnetovallimortis]SLM29531.1 Lytic transglycosylase catalytic [Desulfamplus magnetovallimortis]
MLNLINVIILLIFLTPSFALAEIYSYTDKNGVRHFTNVPTSSNFKLYMKEGKRRRSGRSYKAVDHSTYDAIIHRASRKYGLDTALIKAIIYAESSFNARAVSPKGAKGLMQIMPQNYSSLNISDPFNPFQNIMGGSKYLRQMLQNYKGRVKLALAAYNAGPYAVEKYRGIPPYEETQNYVIKVMDLYRQYKNM